RSKGRRRRCRRTGPSRARWSWRDLQVWGAVGEVRVGDGGEQVVAAYSHTIWVGDVVEQRPVPDGGCRVGERVEEHGDVGASFGGRRSGRDVRGDEGVSVAAEWSRGAQVDDVRGIEGFDGRERVDHGLVAHLQDRTGNLGREGEVAV